MTPPARSYHGYRFPPEIISHAVWLYHRFCLSFRDVEDLLAERGVTVSYEAIRQWCQTFGLNYARRLRRRRGRLGDTWYLDELFVTIRGQRQYLWRSVDQDGDVIDILVQSRRDRRAAARFFRKLLKGQGREPRRLNHGQAAQLRVGASHRDAVSGPQHPAVREQSSGSVSPADAPARATAPEVHLRCARAAFPVGAWRRVESIPSRPSPASGGSLPVATNALAARLAGGDVCLLNERRRSASRGRNALSSST